MTVSLGTWALSHPPFEQVMAQAVQAEQAGFDWITFWDQMNWMTPASLFTPEFCPLAAVLPDMDGFFDPVANITAAASRAPSLRFVNGVLDSVRRHPVMLAQTMLTLDHATQGRTVTLLGTGEGKQMKPYGIARRGAADKLWDGVHILRLLLDSVEPVSYQGRVWKLDRAKVALRPYGERPPPLWLVGGGEALYLAGTLADGWMTHAPSAVQDDPLAYGADIRAVRDHAERAGRDPGRLRFCLIAVCALSDDPDELERMKDNPLIRWFTMVLATPTSAQWKRWGLAHPFGDDWTYTTNMVPYWFSREEALDVADRTPREAVDKMMMLGSPEAVVDRLEPFIGCGVTDIILFDLGLLCAAPDLSGRFRAALEARGHLKPKSA